MNEEEAKQFANGHDSIFQTISSHSRIGIDLLFGEIGNRILESNYIKKNSKVHLRGRTTNNNINNTNNLNNLNITNINNINNNNNHSKMNNYYNNIKVNNNLINKKEKDID